jgi:uncharacterized protein (TIGR04255 family)
MTAYPSPLPEFDAPPVTEVALSVEFLPLANWRSPHAGRYWSRISAEYPKTEELPPLPSQIEKFGEELQQAQVSGPRLQFMDPNATRFWFIGDPGTRLIQVQRDRFVINWRKVTADEAYPRYEKEIRPRFEREWSQFKEFVYESRLGTIDVQQCEVTYVNFIPRGDGWETFTQAFALFSYWSGRGSEGFLPEPESLNLSGSFVMPNESGRLHFSAQRAIRQADERDGLQAQLSARGRPASSADADVLAWMDLGREWIVRGFTDLTSREAHKLWGRRQ